MASLMVSFAEAEFHYVPLLSEFGPDSRNSNGATKLKSCFCGVGLLHVVPPSHFYLPKIDDAPKHINSVQSVASIAAEFMADIGHTFDDDDLKQPYYNMFSLMGTGFFGSVGCIINFGMY
ncbi:hypothetical protein KY290_008715 [Solanum tuberosum]|uniref:Uncharacterized protein n=1 Tax=Solanum tuberosum TaxID=4113 RepID=A0ABQ7W969_SOLTU|nr:hypothetical protein KY290_008715 [Solanum tuberosum]